MGYPLRNVKLFHWWCNKVLPLVYDDSLSYYEVLCKIMSTIKDLIEVEELQNNAITDLDGRVTTAEGDIDNLEGRMDTAEGDIDSLEGRMETAEGDIDNLETRVGTAEDDIDNLETRMGTAEDDIDNLETRMGTAEDDIDNLETRMGTAEDDIDGLETRVGTAEDDIDNLETRMGAAEDDIDGLTNRMVDAENDIDALEPIDYFAPLDKNISGKALYRSVTNGSLINGALGTADLSMMNKQEYGGYYEYDSTKPRYGQLVTDAVWETNRLKLKSGIQYWIGGISAVDDMVVVCYDEDDNVLRFYNTNNSGLYIEDDPDAPTGTYKFVVQADTAYVRAIFPWETPVYPNFVPKGWITYKGDTDAGMFDALPNIPYNTVGMDGRYLANMFDSIYHMVGAELYSPTKAYNAGDYMFIGFTLFRADNNVPAGASYLTNFSEVQIVPLIQGLATQLNGFTIHDIMTQQQYDNLGTYDAHTIYPIVG